MSSVPMWFRRDLHLGDYGSDVDTVRRKLLLSNGIYDMTVVQIVKGICLRHGHESDGTLDEHIALIIGENAANTESLVPEWYEEQEEFRMREILDIPLHLSVFTGIQRWQGNHGFPPTGVITEHQARLIGD